MSEYLTEEKMNALLVNVKELRKGHKLNEYARAPYLVIVDGKFHWIKTIPSLKKLLSYCVFPKMFRVFRNADKGITINLDA